MIVRPTRWIASAILLALAVGTAPANGVPVPTLGSLSVTTAQVGVFYSATIQASGGGVTFQSTNGATPKGFSGGDFVYSITAGALPPGLSFSPTTATPGPMTISGTPTAAGTYNFTVTVSDAAPPPDFRGQDSQSAARRRGLAQSGNHAANGSGNFTITVAPGAAGAAGAPTSPWTLVLVMAGLAGAGFWRLRRA
jgi:hypothetical protein